MIYQGGSFKIGRGETTGHNVKGNTDRWAFWEFAIDLFAAQDVGCGEMES